MTAILRVENGLRSCKNRRFPEVAHSADSSQFAEIVFLSVIHWLCGVLLRLNVVVGGSIIFIVFQSIDYRTVEW